MRKHSQIDVLAYFSEYAIVLAPVLSYIAIGEWFRAQSYAYAVQKRDCGEIARLCEPLADSTSRSRDRRRSLE